MKTSRIFLVALAMTWCAIGTKAQKSEPSTFSVMSLNVDGLPGKILGFNVNADGPQSVGSLRISMYLAKKDCDILCLQEDFNYRWEILSLLFTSYNHDEWSGGINLLEKKIDYAHLQNLKFECDGLNMLWKEDIKTTGYERMAWEKNFGKFSHDFDDIITKGFRRHDVTLPSGKQIVVYNMHMDATSKRDVEKHNDANDSAARQAQWIQLRDYILNHLDNRPVIITGDMNSYYRRDPVKTLFIDVINDSGKATCGDVWVERCNDGSYPQPDSEVLEEETLDKILYINPVDGDQISPVSFTIDKAEYQYNGKPLGDHYPIIATFEFTRKTTTGIQTTEASASEGAAYDLSGRQLNNEPNTHGIYINNGKKVMVK